MLDSTRLIFDAIKKIPEIEQFVLVGGTALSIHCKHRLSEDLDFATGKKLDKAAIKSILHRLSRRHTVVSANDVGEIDEAVNEGLDLYDLHQNYLVDEIKVSFFKFGDTAHEREILNDHIIDSHARILSIHNLFLSKCLVLTERIKSRDLFDLWWMMKSLDYEIEDLVTAIVEYRSHIPYDQIRYRLLDWPIPKTDEGFTSLVSDCVTIQSIRAELREMVNAFEVKAANLLSQKQNPT